MYYAYIYTLMYTQSVNKSIIIIVVVVAVVISSAKDIIISLLSHCTGPCTNTEENRIISLLST